MRYVFGKANFYLFYHLYKKFMALILNIESSTEVCSVSLAKDGTIVQTLENLTGQNHAKLLTSYIQEIFSNNSLTFGKLDAVAVSGGPGSYTGLRIGVSSAKGMCYALNIPLIAITSLAAISHHVIHHAADYKLPDDNELLFCPMIDARRMEVYSAIYNSKEEMVREIKAEIIDHLSFLTYMEKGKMAFFGNGAAKCRGIISHSNTFFIDHVTASAGYMTMLSQKAYQEKNFVDLAYYEPFYLKDFVTTTPKKLF
jgi:tRNA threonylcarbamoyladenosine biosynthesis protein TsaB